MSSKDHQLMIPPQAEKDPNSFELLRVWAANEEQHVSIHSGLNGGASEFGYMLAQLAHHGANLYSQRDHISKSKALSQILKGFQKEIKKNTGEPTGGILE